MFPTYEDKDTKPLVWLSKVDDVFLKVYVFELLYLIRLMCRITSGEFVD